MEKILKKEDWLVIAREYGRRKGAEELAKELGVSKQRIFQVTNQLRKGGVEIPRIRGHVEQYISFVKKGLKQ